MAIRIKVAKTGQMVTPNFARDKDKAIAFALWSVIGPPANLKVASK